MRNIVLVNCFRQTLHWQQSKTLLFRSRTKTLSAYLTQADVKWTSPTKKETQTFPFQFRRLSSQYQHGSEHLLFSLLHNPPCLYCMHHVSTDTLFNTLSFIPRHISPCSLMHHISFCESLEHHRQQWNGKTASVKTTRLHGQFLQRDVTHIYQIICSNIHDIGTSKTQSYFVFLQLGHNKFPPSPTVLLHHNDEVVITVDDDQRAAEPFTKRLRPVQRLPPDRNWSRKNDTFPLKIKGFSVFVLYWGRVRKLVS